MALKTFFLLASLALVLAVASSASSAPPRKRLAGPPEEFQRHAIPNPGDVKITERSITQDVHLEREGDDFVAEISIPVDGPQEFYFTFASPYAKYITLKMKSPRGERVDLAKAEYKVRLFHSLFLSFPDPLDPVLASFERRCP